jgi:excisionase family DNA binding protein
MPKKTEPETALYVRLPATAGEKLDRASQELGIAKKDLVAGLVEKYVNPNTARGLNQLAGATVGNYSFQPHEPPEVMTAEQAADFLQINEHVVLELAEAGKLPGRKLGKEWRFARAALLAWLGEGEKEKRR